MPYCRNYYEKLDILRRCGCSRCEAEFYHLRNGDEKDYRTLSYEYSPPRMIASAILSTKVPKEPQMDEPKNIAIKILVDKLKAEQSSLASNTSTLKTYEDSAKTYHKKKSQNQHAIKDLAAALKKLGHKDA
jgi:hypothetical protein